jgi:hypothetical protein
MAMLLSLCCGWQIFAEQWLSMNVAHESMLSVYVLGLIPVVMAQQDKVQYMNEITECISMA